ncbi:MAG: hypothetical protein H6746_19285 [Deltaproteobacteria bacterium]|nr:hypothetical protein [Deltaproteobacteria bacterium]
MAAHPRPTTSPDPREAAERCPHCLQTYVYELEVRCVDCDGPACPLCVVDVRVGEPAPGPWRCAACRAAPEDG